MRNRMNVLWVVLFAVVAVALWSAWMVRYRPLAVYTWVTRTALARAGLARIKVECTVGTQVAWRGGKGPVLVLLHGAGDQAGAWSRVVHALVKDHTVLVPDLAGHGQSEPAAGPIEVAAILAGLEACIVQQAGGQKVTLVGNSLGAWMAMLIAHDHPGWVERVIAVNGGAIKGRSEAHLLPRNRDEAREVTGLLRDPGSPVIPDFVLDDIVRQAERGPLARFAATAETMERHTLDDRLGEVKVPVEIVWGAADRVMPLEYAQRLLAGLPDARLHVIERCGHVPQQECPEKFLAALLPLLEASK